MAEPAGARGGDERVLVREDARRMARAASTPPACRPGRSTSIGEALTHPADARARHGRRSRPSAGGPTKALGCPIHFSATPTRIDRPAPLLGEHTREVLRECGYADAEIDLLVADGIVATANEDD